LELRSRLLSSVFERIDKDRQITVLDVGPAEPATVEFFSRYRCRLVFADLYSETALTEAASGDISATELDVAFRSCLSYPSGTRFDICLLWDVLSYLPSPAVTAFSRALLPYLSATTAVHCFGTLKAANKMSGQRYSILREDTLLLRPRADEVFPPYPHSQAALKSLLRQMDISKASLQSNGLLEILLEVLKNNGPVPASEFGSP